MLQTVRIAVVALLLFVSIGVNLGCHATFDPRMLSVDSVAMRESMPKATVGSANASSSFNLERIASPRKEGSNDEQERTSWKPSALVPNTSRLMVGENDELPLKAVQAFAQADGFRARVMLDYYFHNDTNRRLEGTFQLRLPNGASPYYIAFGNTAYRADDGFSFNRPANTIDLDLSPDGIRRFHANENVKEARMVPRVKAALAYTSTVKRRIDPALVEWSGSGVFNCRVFPIERKRLHRIVVAYDVNLQETSDSQIFTLHVPGQDVPRIVDIKLRDIPGARMRVVSDDGSATTQRNDYHYFHAKNPKSEVFQVVMENAPSVMLSSDADRAGSFFATRFTPTLPPTTRQGGQSHVVFAIDNSLSARSGQFALWIDLAKQILRNDNEITHFAVMFFNIEQFWWKDAFVENTPANIQAFIDYAESLALEGATDLDIAIREFSSPRWLPKGDVTTHDTFLLSDGSATWGSDNAHVLTKTLEDGRVRRLYAYTAHASKANTALLTHLTNARDGAVFSVPDQSAIQAAAIAHTRVPWRLEGVLIPGGSDVLIHGRPNLLYDGRPLFITGRGLLTGDVSVQLKLSNGDQSHHVDVPISQVIDSPLAPRAYGEIAVSQMESVMTDDSADATNFARHFRVVGQTCSLVMLESEQDYKRFNIQDAVDPSTITNVAASTFVDKRLRAAKHQLTDPKAAFLAWLKQIASATNLNADLVSKLEDAIELNHPDTFIVYRQFLKSSDRTTQSPALESAGLDIAALTDESETRLRNLGRSEALRLYSSLVESNPRDPETVRDVAYSAMAWGRSGHAYHLLKRITTIRPYEPHTYFEMAQCLEDKSKFDLAIIFYELALAIADQRNDHNVRQAVQLAYYRLHRAYSGDTHFQRIQNVLPPRMPWLKPDRTALESDSLITATWNTDDTDIDLTQRGLFSRSVMSKSRRPRHTRIDDDAENNARSGYGPEYIVANTARNTRSKIQVEMKRLNRNRTAQRSRVLVSIYSDWLSDSPTLQRIAVTLTDKKKSAIVTARQ